MNVAAPGERRHVPFHKASFLIVGLVRNCARTLPADIRRLQAAFARAGRLDWLLVESDSDDGTVSVLQQLAGQVERFRFLSLGVLRDWLPLRTARIAHCRNAYVGEIRNTPDYTGIDYVVVADLDGLNTLLDEAALASCWGRNDWDVCTASQAGPYYDIWALRHPDWSPNDCWRQYRFLSGYSSRREDILAAAVWSRMITIPPAAGWIPVESAFGGLAVYRKEMFLLADYRGTADDGGEICEHVPFHHALVRHGCRIFINPAMINAGWTEHSLVLRWRNRRIARLRQLAGKCLRRLAGKYLWRLAGLFFLPRGTP